MKEIESARIPEQLAEYRARAAALLSNLEEARVEFLLPLELLGRDVDQWCFRSPVSRAETPLGGIHQVIVRSLERIQEPAILDAVRRRYDLAIACLGPCEVVDELRADEAAPLAVYWVPEVPLNDERFGQLMMDRRIGCVLVGSPIDAGSGDEIGAKIGHILDAG